MLSVAKLKKMKKLFVTSNELPGTVVDELKDKFDVEIFDKEDLPTKSEIIRGAKDACAIISTVSNRIDNEIAVFLVSVKASRQKSQMR